jgi:hypothetical protein
VRERGRERERERRELSITYPCCDPFDREKRHPIHVCIYIYIYIYVSMYICNIQFDLLFLKKDRRFMINLLRNDSSNSFTPVQS